MRSARTLESGECSNQGDINSNPRAETRSRGDLYISQFSQRENAIKSLSQLVRVAPVHGSLTQVDVFTSRRNAIS